MSKHLFALETALGQQLFVRQKGALMTPTRAARELYKTLEGPMDVLEKLPAIVKELAKDDVTRIHVAAALPIINSSLFADVMRRFRKQHPGVRVSLEARHRVDVEELVVSRQVDIAFGLLPSSYPGLSTAPLIDVDAVAVVAKAHPLRRSKTATWNQLATYPLILPSRQPLRTRLDQYLERSGCDVALEASSTITCCRLAADGFGVAVCDPFSPTAFREAELASIPLRPRIKLTYGALIAEQRANSSLLQGLLQIFADAASAI